MRVLAGAVLSLNLQDTPNVFAEQLGWGRNARICVASLRRQQLTQRNETPRNASCAKKVDW